MSGLSSSSTSSDDYSPPSLSSSVSSVSSASSLSLSPIAGPALKLNPLPVDAPPFSNSKKQPSEYAFEVLSRTRDGSDRARPVLCHRRHSASCGQSALAPRPAGVGKSTKPESSHANKRGAFVNSLVDSAALMIEAVWPSARDASGVNSTSQILPLRTFIEETLRRSRTSYSTLQVALYYLYILRPHVQNPERLQGNMGALHCGRRAFLTSLILASKYLQDKNYSSRAWSKISGLTTSEINANEMAFLIAVDWKIHVPEDVYGRWTSVLLSSTCLVSQKRVAGRTVSTDGMEISRAVTAGA